MKHLIGRLIVLAMAVSAPLSAVAQKKYDPGASDTEIKIGQTMPYSGPASAYGTIGKATAAYFQMINEKGGINGRKINFLSVDDAYSPPKTVEMVRRLVEQDEVLFIMNPLGTSSNTAIHKYMNAKKVPQLFVSSGASKWNDPKHFPWTMGWQPTYPTEGRIYAKHLLKTKPDAKIAILYQNDDYGKDYLKGFKEGLGSATKQIVSEQSYEVTDPTVDSQMVAAKSSGADAFFNITTPKFAAMAIRKAYDIGWHPVHYLNNVSATVGSVLEPAGLEKSKDLITTQYLMDPTDPRFADSPAIIGFKEFMAKHYPDGNVADASNIFAFAVAQAVVQVLKQCGDDLTRANVMKQAASLKDFSPAGILPGIKANTSATDFAPLEAVQMVKFDGKSWIPFGDIAE